jgi:hypothetical protein
MMKHDKTTKNYLMAAAAAFALAASTLVCPHRANVTPKDRQERVGEFTAMKPEPETPRIAPVPFGLVPKQAPTPARADTLADLISNEFPPGSLDCGTVSIQPGLAAPDRFFGDSEAYEHSLTATLSACHSAIGDKLDELVQAKDPYPIFQALWLMDESDMSHQLDVISEYLRNSATRTPILPDPECLGRNICQYRFWNSIPRAFISLVHENRELEWMVSQLPDFMKSYVENELMRKRGIGNVHFEDVSPGMSAPETPSLDPQEIPAPTPGDP